MGYTRERENTNRQVWVLMGFHTLPPDGILIHTHSAWNINMIVDIIERHNELNSKFI